MYCHSLLSLPRLVQACVICKSESSSQLLHRLAKLCIAGMKIAHCIEARMKCGCSLDKHACTRTLSVPAEGGLQLWLGIALHANPIGLLAPSCSVYHISGKRHWFSLIVTSTHASGNAQRANTLFNLLFCFVQKFRNAAWYCLPFIAQSC